MQRWTILTGLFLICSCSGDDDEPELTRGDFCSDWAEAACSEETVSRCQASDVDACRLSQASFCLELVPETFDPAQASQCIRAVRNAYDDADLDAEELRTVLRLEAPCDRLVRGPAGQGATCDSDSDCATPDGFECVRKGGEAMGTCQEPEEVGAGESCAAPEQVCAEGLFCNGANCIVYLALGMACMANEECGPAARCQNDECVPRLVVGADCANDDDCASGVCLPLAAGASSCTDRVTLGRADPICEDLR